MESAAFFSLVSDMVNTSGFCSVKMFFNTEREKKIYKIASYSVLSILSNALIAKYCIML